MVSFRSWLRRRFPTRTPGRPIARLRFDRLEDRSVPPVFTLPPPADAGAGPPRQAILDSNAAPAADTINFAIGSGPQTILLASDLPTVTDTVRIDGTSQPGFAGSPLVELTAPPNTVATGLKVE